ncbi:MAG: type I methionyl aminopeptidase [Lentisphaeria bacterium]|nr:type I methionyl aminopeptidase [Lentisphaeria bacterium]
MTGRQVVIHSPREIEGIRRAAAATATVLEALVRAVRPGMSTLELDRLAADCIAREGGRSAFLGYHGFPGTICVSVNEEVIHGIGRADRVIAPGDLVSMDVGVQLDGFIGDTARTVCAGGPPVGAAASLLAAAGEALAAGIEKAVAGNYVNDISRAVEAVVRRYGFTAVRDFVGHGCGCALHEPPEIPNFAQRRPGPQLAPGMVLAIEPMVNTGSHRVEIDPQDRWTVRTADGGLAAHVEHMVLITRGKAEILTWPRTASE